MRNFQDTFEARKRSLFSAFSICMTVPLSLKELPENFENIYINKLENSIDRVLRFLSRSFDRSLLKLTLFL